MSLLSDLSASISGLAAEASPRIVAVRGTDGGSFSGFVWRSGLVVVAEEALEGEEELDLLFADGKTVKAKLAGRDPTTDVALLETETGEFPEWAAAPAAAPAPWRWLPAVARDSLVARLATIVSVGPKWQSRRGGEIAARITLDQRLTGGRRAPRSSPRTAVSSAWPSRCPGVAPLSSPPPPSRGRGHPEGKRLRAARLAGRHAPHPMTAGSGAIVLSAEDDSPAAKAGLLVGDVITTWNGEGVGTVGSVASGSPPQASDDRSNWG